MLNIKQFKKKSPYKRHLLVKLNFIVTDLLKIEPL
jgi:hypothetical protein